VRTYSFKSAPVCVLNDDLADDFRRWHPGFTHTIEGSPAGLAVAA
jgi:hypothetical protein